MHKYATDVVVCFHSQYVLQFLTSQTYCIEESLSENPGEAFDFIMGSQPDNNALYASAQKNLLVFGSSFLPDVIVRTSGLYLYSASGRKIMDWTSGQMSCLIGHGHPAIAQTIAEHAAKLDHLYSGMLSPPVIELGAKLTSVLPDGLDKAMFLSTGGESNECAIKLAKMYTGKFEIVGLGASWHGVTSGANGAQYHAARKGYGPVVRYYASPSKCAPD